MEAVDRTLSLIEQLAKSPSGIGVIELADRMGLASSTVHRYLAALQARGYVVQTGDRSYRLTARMYLVGLAARLDDGAEAHARPSLQRLADASGETACMWIRDGAQAVCIGQIESTKILKITARPGSRQDLRVGASSRVLLAYMSERERDGILTRGPIRAYTRDTVTDIGTLRRILGEVRAQGYGVSVGEIDAGVVGIAAPVRDPHGEVVAALSVVAPQARMSTGSSFDGIVRLVVSEAERLSPIQVGPSVAREAASA